MSYKKTSVHPRYYDHGEIGNFVQPDKKETGKVALWQQTGISVISNKQYKLFGYMKLQNVTGRNISKI